MGGIFLEVAGVAGVWSSECLVGWSCDCWLLNSFFDNSLPGHPARIKIPAVTMQPKVPKLDQPRTNHFSGRPAVLVASGIMFSTLPGLIRQAALAHFLGTLPAPAP